MTLAEPILSFEQVCRTLPPAGKSASSRKSTGAKEPQQGPIQLLRQINLTVYPGECLNLVGPSGSGKSTLLRLINRLDDASTGQVKVLGKSVQDWPIRELRLAVSMVFQEPSLLDQTPRQNLHLPFGLCGVTPDRMEDRIAEACRLAGFDMDLLDRAPGELSVGQKQRATLARSLITEPQILLLDEPTSGLDPPTANDLLDRLDILRREKGLTLLIVTHRLYEVRRLGGSMAVMMAGELVAHGLAEKLLTDPPEGPVARFLEEAGRGSR